MNVTLQSTTPELHRLVSHYFPEAKLSFVERMEGGVSADVYLLGLSRGGDINTHVVLRCHGATHYGHNAELEFKLLDALSVSGLSVPKPICFDASCTQLECPFVLIEYVEGSSNIDQSHIKSQINQMAAELARIHGSQTDALPSLPKRVDPVPELLELLPQSNEWQSFRGWLGRLANAPFTGQPVLLHGDYWPSNLLWSEGQIAAVLDWEDAALGDPLSDVACACLELRYIYGDFGKDLFETSYGRLKAIETHRLMLWLAYVSSAALKYMGDWGLEPDREIHMRQVAHQTLRQAVADLLR